MKENNWLIQTTKIWELFVNAAEPSPSFLLWGKRYLESIKKVYIVDKKKSIQNSNFYHETSKSFLISATSSEKQKIFIEMKCFIEAKQKEDGGEEWWWDTKKSF